MDVPIIIPSKGRSDVGSTWDVIDDCIIAVHKSEKKDYAGFSKNIWTHNTDGISFVRNAIIKKAIKKYGKGAWIIMMDDDIKKVGKFKAFGNGKNKPVKMEFSDFYSELVRQITAADKKGYHLIGIAPSKCELFFSFKNRVNTNLFVIGSLMAIKLSDLRFDEKCLARDDYDFTCQNIAAGSGVLRLNYLWHIHDYAQLGGGNSDEGRVLKDKKSIKYLLDKWPMLIKKHPTRENEVSLIDPRKRKATNGKKEGSKKVKKA